MVIPFLDLGAATAELRAEIDGAIARVLSSGWYIGGPECEAFEQAFARYTQADHCVGVGNGLDALHLILRALEIGPGDEVIVAANTFIATVLAVSMVGATPVLVEPDPRTHNMDPQAAAAAINARTRMILPTHLYGQPADLDALTALAERHGLLLVEDAAQAQGARHRGRRIGAHSAAAAWSFYPGKNLGALGDAGAVTTDDPALAARIRQLGNYGSPRRYVNEVKGVNSRLDPLQAAVLGEKLKVLDEWNGRRAAVAARYLEAFADLPLGLPYVPGFADPAWHLFVVTSPERDRLAASLAEQGVGTIIHYPVPPHLQHAYADLRLGPGTLPVAEQLASEVLSLPIGPHLGEEQAGQVIDAVRRAYGR